jgi:hypothetical protein
LSVFKPLLARRWIFGTPRRIGRGRRRQFSFPLVFRASRMAVSSRREFIDFLNSDSEPIGA